MANKQIFVGNEYKEAFNSICSLIEGGCLTGLKYTISNGVISDGVYDYVLSEQSGEESESVKHGFRKNGATWFKSLRGESTQNTNAIWTSFIETVKMEFHKRYSIVEYKEQLRTATEKQNALNSAKSFIDTFTEVFFPDYAGKTEVRQVSAGEKTEDVYGVAMRIELSGGTGASLPVLGKIYFNKTGNNVRPIASRTSSNIDANLNNIVPDEDDSPSVDFSDSVITTTLNAMEKMVEDEHFNFADYLCYVDEKDKLAISNLLEKMSHDAFELECQKIDVLYITHIKVGVFIFDVYSGVNPLFRVTLGLNNTFSVKCLNCADEELLVNRNEIACNVDGKEVFYTLDTEKESFGLDEEAVDNILYNSCFDRHYIRISCPNNSRNLGCETLKCASQLFYASDGEQVYAKCADCPYPEVVYTTLEGEKKYTPLLLFAKDKMELVEKSEDVAHCSLCGRCFSSSELINSTCPLCRELKSPKNKEKATLTYKKYKNVLSLRIRLFALNKEKYCVEDEELILFGIGKKKYAFNKLNVTASGFISKPRKLK